MAETTKKVTTLVLGEEDGEFAIPVKLAKISERADVELDSASPAGNIIKQVYVDGKTGKPLARDEIRKGIFRSKPKKSDKDTWSDFKAIAKADLEAIEEAASLDSFVIEHFIPLRDVPFERVMEAYYLAPAEGMSAKPLVLIARALRKTKRAGVFKMVKSTRQYLAVVYEKNGGLIVNTLAFANNFAAVREAAEALDASPVKIVAAELDMAVQAVEAWANDASVLDGYEDDLVPLKADLVERALLGKELPKRAKREAVEAIDGDGDLTERLTQTLRRTGKKASVTPKEPATA